MALLAVRDLIDGIGRSSLSSLCIITANKLLCCQMVLDDVVEGWYTSKTLMRRRA